LETVFQIPKANTLTDLSPIEFLVVVNGGYHFTQSKIVLGLRYYKYLAPNKSCGMNYEKK